MRRNEGTAIIIAVIAVLLVVFLLGLITWDHLKKWRECEEMYRTPQEQYFCKRNKGVVR